MPMPLNQLLPSAGSDLLIRELTLDSRAVKPGDLFLAIKGTQRDGRGHIADALAKGAAAVAYEAEGAPELAATDAELVPIKGLASHLSAIASRFYGEPSRSLACIGITGTNGKTSVSQLLAQALDQLQLRCAIVGTLGNGFYGALAQGGHTTPDPVAVQATLASLKQAGARAVAMEVSSHGLDQGRVAAVDFNVAVFTNLSRDHLDYHGSMQAYGAAKAKLFSMPNLRWRVINIDDAFGQTLASEQGAAELLSYSIDNQTAKLHCRDVRFSHKGVEVVVVTPVGEGLLKSPLLGRFNLSNLLAVVGSLLALDLPLADILPIVPTLNAPAGRMQRLGGVDKPLVVIDYAHTPDALENALNALKVHAHGKLLCLFGCGGDRDKGKRPLMAEVAERLADQVWVTDDNPRTESAQAIQNDIRQGFKVPERVHFVLGRAQAIAEIIAKAGAQDVVVLAGKGHEDYQEIAGVRHPFSDIEYAMHALALWGAQDA